jgi:hypothetical protein
MRVQDAINALMELDKDEEVMIQWYTKADADYMEEDNPLPKEQWELAVRRFDKNPPDADDFSLQYFIDDAGERLASDS